MKSVQGRIDALVFSGGIGENSSLKRGHIIQHLRKQEFIDYTELLSCYIFTGILYVFSSDLSVNKEIYNGISLMTYKTVSNHSALYKKYKIFIVLIKKVLNS